MNTDETLRAAQNAVSIFAQAAEAAIFVVKGMQNVEYLAALCERQGLMTAGKPVEGEHAGA